MKGKGKIVYARVSSRNQKEDLASQAMGYKRPENVLKRYIEQQGAKEVHGK